MEVITYGMLMVMEFATLEQCEQYAQIIYQAENIQYGAEPCFKKYNIIYNNPLPRPQIPLFF
tara:strand:- start:918 stop:1103 length:186 start_codon:yes stop_codon:yes gene_type:complete